MMSKAWHKRLQTLRYRLARECAERLGGEYEAKSYFSICDLGFHVIAQALNHEVKGKPHVFVVKIVCNTEGKAEIAVRLVFADVFVFSSWNDGAVIGVLMSKLDAWLVENTGRQGLIFDERILS